jgi:hypothetical protein
MSINKDDDDELISTFVKYDDNIHITINQNGVPRLMILFLFLSFTPPLGSLGHYFARGGWFGLMHR